MLRSIDIKNVAVIEELSLDFYEGMTVLTGETGAGKSIIIDAVTLVLGARTSKTLVRRGAKKAFVSACFDVTHALFPRLEQLGIDAEEELIISRELTEDGKSTARINGVMVTANILREVSELLLNIHGQQDSHAILNSAHHAELLDEYADCGELLEEYQKKLSELKEIKKQIANLEMDEEEKLRRTDMLKYQVDEIEKAELSLGEKEALTEERTAIVNSARISEGISAAYSALYDNGGLCAYDAISTAERALSEISEYDKEIAAVCEKLSEVKYTVEDIVHELGGHDAEYSENYLNDLEERLDTISKLEKKYGGSVAAVLEFYEAAVRELESIQNSDELAKELARREKIKHDEAAAAGEKLFLKRKAAGEKIAELIEKELSELDMEKAVFKASVEHTGEFFKNGMDSIEFLISANPGEEPKPLAKVASGGELSRTMLAIKTVLAGSQSAPTMIFDEIDTGVSGSAAKKIAVKLWGLAQKNQVICISHQPQPAAFADNHYYIEKNVSKGAARTSVRILNAEERVRELARIIDGADITETALEHAAQMRLTAEEKKAEYAKGARRGGASV